MEEDIKVSQLPEASAINDEDLLMIVQNGVNKKITKENCQFASGDEISIGTTEPTGEEKIWIDPTEIPSGIGTDISNVYSVATDKAYSCNYSNEHYGGVVLYENASGSNQTINLSDSASNYDHFVIVYKNTDWNEVFTHMKFDSGSAISITGNHVSSTDRDLYTFNLTMSGTTITWGTSLFSSNNGTPFAYNPFKITKVIGYK